MLSMTHTASRYLRCQNIRPRVVLHVHPLLQASNNTPAHDLQHNTMEEATHSNSIEVNDLNFTYGGSYDQPGKHALKGLNMQLAPGARCLLIGANGAGKSTILRILAGRHLVKPDTSVRVLGKSSFHDTSLNFERAYLDTEWGMRTVAFAGYGVPLQADIAVSAMMTKLQSDYPERRDELIQVLGIDVNWRMHRVSDGQRRRVQIFLGLIRPFKLLLLDEVTVSLDVVVRQDLLRWLMKESEEHGATIIYATHIFDGLDDWPTHIHYLHYSGRTGWQGRLGDLELYQKLRADGHPSPMLRIAETWLRAELQEMKAKNEHEREDGAAAREEDDALTTPYISGGGFASGRMYDYSGV